MSQEKHYSCSTMPTSLDSLDHSLHIDIGEMQQNQSAVDASNQIHVENKVPPSFIDMKDVLQEFNETQKKTLSRWDECLSKQLQTETTTYQNSSANQRKTVQPSMDKAVVREVAPRTAQDPILPILRDLFVRSLDHFYKEIEAQLKLKTNETLSEWLQETFSQMQQRILTKEYRCFVLCSANSIENDPIQHVIGFFIVKEEAEGSIYIAQCAVEPESKRRGYGARLLQHLRDIYPPGTSYWGLCRRANIPAVKFYLKQGAQFIDNEEVAKKYGYDPALYTGFEFIDNRKNSQPSYTDCSSILSSVSSPTLQEDVLSSDLRPHITCKDSSTMTNPLPDFAESKKTKKNKRCTIV